MKFCPNCGNEVKEGADICLSCGKILNQKYNSNKIPGKGMSVASLVLGIISIVWSFLMILSLSDGIELLSYYNYDFFELICYYIGYTLFSLIPAILGLIFGINSKKKYISGKSTAGIVLSIISLAICTLILILFIVNF